MHAPCGPIPLTGKSHAVGNNSFSSFKREQSSDMFVCECLDIFVFVCRVYIYICIMFYVCMEEVHVFMHTYIEVTHACDVPQLTRQTCICGYLYPCVKQRIAYDGLCIDIILFFFAVSRFLYASSFIIKCF